MTWLTAAVFSYLILAFVSLVDKRLLISSIPNPKVYSFYVGLLGISILALIPFVGFYIPGINQIILSTSSGFAFIFGLFWLYKGLRFFDVSRVAPSVGGLIPLFSFGLIYLFSKGKETLFFSETIAFLFLIIGSVLINFKKGKKINLKSLKFSVLAAFFLALSFVLIKYVYLAQPFWSALMWRSIGGFLVAISFFILFPEIKKEIFKKKENQPIGGSKKTAIIFLSNQAAGAGATVLQNWAIYLAPLIYVPFVNALQGVQYVFILILTVFLSFKFPKILKEEVSKEVLLQKIIAILSIGIGLAILMLT